MIDTEPRNTIGILPTRNEGNSFSTEVKSESAGNFSGKSRISTESNKDENMFIQWRQSPYFLISGLIVFNIVELPIVFIDLGLIPFSIIMIWSIVLSYYSSVLYIESRDNLTINIT